MKQINIKDDQNKQSEVDIEATINLLKQMDKVKEPFMYESNVQLN
jgi:hypothetical protein